MTISDEDLAAWKQLAPKLPDLLDEIAEARSARRAAEIKPETDRAKDKEIAARLAVAKGQKLVRIECPRCDFAGLARARPEGFGDVAAKCPGCDMTHSLGAVGEVDLVDA